MSRHYFTKSLGIACIGVLICLVLLAICTSASAATNAECLSCHSAPTLHKTSGLKKTSLYVHREGFAASSHAKLNCVDCHADLKKEPLKHKAEVAPVNCAGCHEKSGWNPNTIHHAVSDMPETPRCQTCHGSHYIRPAKDEKSQTNRVHADALCAQCHAKEKATRNYEHGIHSVMAENGRPAAGCIDCHESHSGRQAVNPVTCGKCHRAEHKEYAESSHGIAFLSGNTDAPTCVSCHAAHKALPKKDLNATIHPMGEPQMCARCHDDEKIAGKHDLPMHRLETYRESYHGVANKHGDVNVATCSNCHQAHHVLPSSDPASATHKENLPKTCGKCHDGMLKKVAQGQMHVVIAKENNAPLYWISFGFKWLTIGTMLALCGHIVLDLNARMRERRRSRRNDS